MTTIAQSPVNIQTSVESVPAVPAWFGEITLFAHYLTRQKIGERISEQVRFTRRRFGQYEVIDFVAVLFGYAVSGERTLEAFYQPEQLNPFIFHRRKDKIRAHDREHCRRRHSGCINKWPAKIDEVITKCRTP